MEPQTSYRASWDFLKAQYRRLWILHLTFFPGVAGIGFPLGRLFHSDLPTFVLWSCWAVGFLVTGGRVQGFRCPRCGRGFFESSLLMSGLVRWCSHCRLPKWGEDPEGDALRGTR